MKARDLVIAAMRTARAVDPLETPDANEIALGMQELNSLLEVWDAEKLMPYCNRSATATVAPGQSSYTISGDAGSDIVTDRPIRITGLQLSNGSAWVPLQEWSYDEYSSDFSSFSAQGTPARFVYNPAFPAGEIILLPIPSQSLTLRVSTTVRVGDLNVDSVVDLPPGYVPAIQWDLARILAPIYHIPDTQDIALEAKRRIAVIKRLTDKTRHLTSGLAPLGQSGRRGFNMLSPGY